MSIKSDLWTYLTSMDGVGATFSNRIYPSFAPSSAARPFLIYERSSSHSTHHLGTASSDPGCLMQDNFSFTIFAQTEKECNDAKTALQTALDGIEMTIGHSVIRRIFLSSESDGIEYVSDGENEANYKETLDFTVWHRQSPNPLDFNIIKTEGDDFLLLEDGS